MLIIKSLPDISKWNTNNATNMSYMFSWCLNLSSLLDISKWDIINVIDMNHILNQINIFQLLIKLVNLSGIFWMKKNIFILFHIFNNFF